ncbi:zinc finger BED domain-containing protein RICESLEEPER 2 [Tanacetum coccineum]
MSDQSSTNEYGIYIETGWINTMQPEEFKKFDILAWWKGWKTQFPVLAAMARDLLSVQASIVASEFVFSTSGRVLSIRRTRLMSASLEMCICLKDHLDADEPNIIFDEELALDEATSEARSSEVDEEDVNLEQALI